ncbi:MAG: bifunctional alpha,alpha-trehalose-phosphate synthase (UDP-forming)/trehalose-phosphatase [Candidatus Latescibacter sp.]|nr:bifunctional alpha,alpha-trehalose-phosphate synthase (UDP-forming)/trehalose-phosphatase [Candidatus Latescibacter sp.]
MRLLVVSNRLPVTVINKDKKLLFQESVGGLVSGISAYLDSLKGSSFIESDYLWVGWPGITLSGEQEKELKYRDLAEFHAYPVFVPEETMDKFYHGFCNKTIWPLFHYFPSYAAFDEDCWDCYLEVNKLFCNTVLEMCKPDDIVWIHDYHLMLLPALLRKRAPDIPIGFFLHIPFPSFEIFRLLPRKWSREILEGLLGADLIGFHTYDYTQNFLRCVLRMLGYEHNMGKLILESHNVMVDTFPMGIDFGKYQNVAKSAEVKKRRNQLLKQVADHKIIMSADRLDYSKGILNRLKGYDAFLDKNPDYHEKVILILLVVPSRIGVEKYQQMKKQIDEYVGKINGKFGSLTWTPIIYLYKYESLYPLVALYSISDIALITPLRDGMNLIAKEYVSARIDQTGVLILSEMAGAAKELGEAILINPNSIEEISDALKQALEMREEEQIRRNRIMQTRLQRYDVVKWAEDFIHKLTSSRIDYNRFKARFLNPAVWSSLIRDYKNARKRLILLDYDGTLVPFADRPELAKPDNAILRLLESLHEDSQNEVVIISGRDRKNLESWFGSLGIGLVAEHGAWIKESKGEWNLMEMMTADWKPHLYTILENYADRLPGAFIEEKDFSLVWHYRMSDPEQSSIRAKELLDDLVNFTANINVQILQGNKVIEVRNSDINKGTGTLHFLSGEAYDFILAIGDDWTDEDLFKVLPESAYTIRVGMTWSYARFNLMNYKQVQQLLQDIVS